MVLLKYRNFELRTVERAAGPNDIPMTKGICVWHQGNYIGIMEPENDAIPHFVAYPTMAFKNAMEDTDNFSKVLGAATQMVQGFLSLL